MKEHLDVLRRQSSEAGSPQRENLRLQDLSTTLTGLRESAEEICVLNQRLTRASLALEAEHLRYLELFEFAPDGYLVTDERGTIQEANRAAEVLIKEQRKNLIGRPLALFIGEAQRRTFRAQLRRLCQGHDDRVRSRAFRLKQPSGRGLDVSLSVAATRSPEGRLTRLRWLMRDISEHRQAEEAVKAAHAALQRNREELRGLAARLLTAQEEERRRVSRELHDDMSQKLAMLMVAIETLERNLPASPFEILEQLRSFRDRAAELSDDARNLAYRLHPSILEDLGLAVAMRSYIKDFTEREGIRVRFRQKGLPPTLSQEIASCLYRVAQESLRNAAKHARTAQISVTLTRSANRICLSVRDWGVGFDPESQKVQHGGLGIISMQERVRLVNGTFCLRSKPGHGTEVMIRLPFQESPS